MVSRSMVLAVFVSASLGHFSIRAAEGPHPENARGAVGVYEELQAHGARARPQVLNRYPASMKAAVWSHHFLTALDRHPEFDQEQRRILMDAAALLTPRFFDLDPSLPEWAEVVDAPMRELHSRAIRAFPPALVRELFLDMGPRLPTRSASGGASPQSCDDPYYDYNKAPATDGTRVARNAPDCTCSPQSDYCDWGGLGEYYCKHSWCVLVRQACGTLWRYDCVGLCHQRTGGG